MWVRFADFVQKTAIFWPTISTRASFSELLTARAVSRPLSESPGVGLGWILETKKFSRENFFWRQFSCQIWRLSTGPKFRIRFSRSCEQLQTNGWYRWKGLVWGNPAFWKPKIFPAKNVHFRGGTRFSVPSTYLEILWTDFAEIFFMESPSGGVCAFGL